MGLHPATSFGRLQGVAHRKLVGVDDLYIAQAANWKSAQAGCGVVAHRQLAGVDD